MSEPKNVSCKTCGAIQSSTFHACIYCCPHPELELSEEWQDSGGWGLAVECSACGKNFGFTRGALIKDYKLVRKEKAAA